MVTLEVIQGCKEGNRKCQDALVHSTAPALMAICMRYMRDRSTAEDVIQETYINVFQYLNSYRNDGSFEAWIRRIAVRNCIKQLNNQKNFILTDTEMVNESTQVEIPDVYGNMNARELMDLIATLPPSLSTVFNMYVIDGYSHNEIGVALGITESTSRSALTKARAKLIEKMKQPENKIFHWAAAL
jgi:RNA polymerase sigma factor (sigma-70 family)